MILKNGFGISIRYLFYQPMDEKIKTFQTLCLSSKGNRNMEKALFDRPIVLQDDVKTKK